MAEHLPLQYIKGVGPRRAAVLANEGISTLQDLALYVPKSYVERSAARSIAALKQRAIAPSHSLNIAQNVTAQTAPEARVFEETTLVVSVQRVVEKVVGRNKKMLSVTVVDGSSSHAKLIFWNYLEYYRKLFSTADTVVISGTYDYEERFGELTFTHPDVERIESEDLVRYQQGAILPKYTVTQAMRTAGITLNLLRTIVEFAVAEVIPKLEDAVPEPIRKKYSLMPKKMALAELHNPTHRNNIELARYRMKFEELFFFELLLAARANSKKNPELGLVVHPKSKRARELTESLPFELTSAQKKVIHEIISDMSTGAPMNRLLQGDVGSGKTVVALLCMLCAVDNGYQTLIMAPTEILAEQHLASIKKYVQGLDVHVVQLVGGQHKKKRADVLSQISSGEAQIIIGTHALFEAEVEYHKLGLIVVDEQHRFGVAQRALLQKMGRNSFGDSPRTPHVLVMSATPIPRTLSMTLYGDLDVSIIDILPKNRKPISTHVVFESQLASVFQFMKDEIAKGRQAYIVYPLVEASEKMNLKSAVEHQQMLSEHVFEGLKVGLLHGQMLWYEKEDAMKAFLNKEYDILVATTVVEVGIDVPNASVMLIENAERFGLSQLHQLRGRVGRGTEQSYCFLATADNFRYALKKNASVDEGAKAATRLRTMEKTTDGFEISEVDMQLRGPGDMMGTRQSGLPDFSFVNLVTDHRIIADARNEAFALLNVDPKLAHPEYALARKKLIELFEGATTYMTVA